MGSSSSKSATRRLPQQLSQAAEARTHLPRSQLPPSSDPTPPPGSSSGAASRASTGNVNYSASRTTGAGTEYGRGRSNVYASEEKDDSIRKDGADPDFLSNLSRLGQVSVPKPGTPFEQQAPALRTLLSRTTQSTSTTSLPPPGHLTATSLSNLLDRLKTLPPGSNPSHVYKEYGVSEKTMQGLRRWVNSVSIDKERTRVLISEQGEESVEMTAVWVDSVAMERKKVDTKAGSKA